MVRASVCSCTWLLPLTSEQQGQRVRSLLRWSIAITLGVCIVSALGCERKQSARERDAVEARAKAAAEAKAALRRAAEPMPEEPPVELTRTESSGLPCAVDEVFARKCRRCHTVPTRHGAPFVFLTWDDTQQERGGQKLVQLIGRAVRSNFMPYRIEANPPVQPLTDEEKQIILAWVDADGPRGNCDANGASGQKSASPSPSAAPKKPAVTKPSAAAAASAGPAR